MGLCEKKLLVEDFYLITYIFISYRNIAKNAKDAMGLRKH